MVGTGNDLNFRREVGVRAESTFNDSSRIFNEITPQVGSTDYKRLKLICVQSSFEIQESSRKVNLHIHRVHV